MKHKLQDEILNKEPNTKEELLHNLQALTEAIIDMTDEIVPKTKPFPYVKQW